MSGPLTLHYDVEEVYGDEETKDFLVLKVNGEEVHRKQVRVRYGYDGEEDAIDLIRDLFKLIKADS